MIAVAPGSTQIVIVTPSAFNYLSVVVIAPPGVLFGRGGQFQNSNGLFATQYDSFSRRLQNIVEYRIQSGDRFTSLYLNDTILRSARGHTRHMIPSASFRIFTRDRGLVLLDDIIQTSPLTLEGQVVRGVHVRNGGLELHAGYSSFSIFDNLLFSRNRAAVAGISYRYRLSDKSSLMPQLYVFPTRNSGRGTDGTVASAAYEFNDGPAFRLRAEAAVSHRLDRSPLLPGAFLEMSRMMPEFASAGSTRRSRRSSSGVDAVRPSCRKVNSRPGISANTNARVGVCVRRFANMLAAKCGVCMLKKARMPSPPRSVPLLQILEYSTPAPVRGVT